MRQAAHTSDSAVDTSARFLGELDNLWSLLRLYGTTHPAFRRSAESTAAAASRPLRVSLSPKGFTVDKTTLDDPLLLAFSRKLRSLGLVGLAVEQGLKAGHVTALILALDEADRTHVSGPPVADRIAAATERHVAGIPLRVEGLRLMEGTSEEPEADGQASVWREMFASAWHSGGPGGTAGDPEQLAESFELALRAVGSPAQWEAMVGAWVRQLATVDVSPTAEPRGVPTGFAGGAQGTAPAPATSGSQRLDAVASFLSALSPTLSRRLLAETFNGQAAPHNVVLALAERLPKGIVLGALASVDRTNGQPSTAALALLRKIAGNLTGGGAAPAAPRTTTELAEIASSLERLLGADQEAAFVPEGYLQNRQDLSGRALAPDGMPAVPYPTDRETTRHAAGLAFQILSTPDASAPNVASALAFVGNRLGTWIRSGEYEIAAEGLGAALSMSGHWDRAVAKPAAELAAHAVQVEDLLESARHATDRAAAVAGIARVLRCLDGTALAMAFSALKPASPGPNAGAAGTAGPSGSAAAGAAGATSAAPGSAPAAPAGAAAPVPAGTGGYDVVLEAMRRVLPTLPEEAVRGLCKTFKDTTPPPALLVVLSGLRGADAIKAVSAIVAHASSATRVTVVHVIFRHGLRWPLSLTERLLKDEEPELRRLAVMKLVGDTDLPTAARFLQASSRAGDFEADVALGLAELLRRHRNHPDVRAAWRQWLWSKRRWAALLFSPVSTGRRAA